ncbi:alpha/beta fold hydrolase [Deinococcus fonticola]|uniref:alpha/beta fold hydrolase n=1 Tax=Deinococcus fonticola TaxID=2528713 RepID=UPI00142F4947|nr:alpha/beta fold hydrolase [Deinococcus fonticola]
MHFQAPDGTNLFTEQLGDGEPLLVLSGGPGCVNYLRPVAELLEHRTCFLTDPRGVGRSQGRPHDIATGIADLEALREHLNLDAWDVLGHSWGADLGLAYALMHPDRVSKLISFAGTGIQYDRDWKAAYEAGKHLEADFVVEYSEDVHAALRTDYRRFIKTPDLLARLSRLNVPITFLHMGADIRPSWPARQLAYLLPNAEFVELPGAPHNAWLTHARPLGEVLRRLLGRA